MRIFGASQSAQSTVSGDFAYLDPQALYLDSACQTLRPQCVIDVETAYYKEYNACGGRVKYPWGVRVDAEVNTVRQKLLDYAGKSSKEYVVAFTLNTTYGINVVVQQLPADKFDRIVTSEIEHNSAFLPSITWAAMNKKERRVLPRNDDGSLRYTADDLTKAAVLVNSTSNIDGRQLMNAKALADDAHKSGGILLLDAAQTFGHAPEMLRGIDFDAAFGSGHKMYGPSLGFVIIKRELLKQLNIHLVGGGTVQDVERDAFSLIENPDEFHARLELGLQNWAGIIGLGAAIDWLSSQRKHDDVSSALFDGLKKTPRVQLVNMTPSNVVSFSVENLDAHRLALYLGEQQIMCRSGYFCCHYYLQHVKKLPPLLRVSLGKHNTLADVERFFASLTSLLSVF